MKITYTSFDGKEFCSEEECLAYEREVDKKEYHKDFVEGPLKKRADFVMDAFLNASRTRYETDEVLEKKVKIQDILVQPSVEISIMGSLI